VRLIDKIRKRKSCKFVDVIDFCVHSQAMVNYKMI